MANPIDNLYAAFAHCGLRRHIEGCPCCVSAADGKLLRHVPLRELSSQDLGRYAFKAMTTWGDVADFRHFLPRIFELLATDVEWPIEYEIVVGKLAYAKWETWPQEEREAIEAFLISTWQNLLAEYPHPLGWRACTMLYAIGQVADLNTILEYWTASHEIAPARHLAEFISDNLPELRKRRQLGNPFWKGHETQRNQVEDWLFSGQPSDCLGAALSELADENINSELSEAIATLSWVAP